MFNSCKNILVSSIEYVDQDPNKKSLNLNSIEQYSQQKYKANRRVLKPGDVASLATKACPFPHYNPLFAYKRQEYGDEEELNDESLTFDGQRRKTLKTKRQAYNRTGGESLKSDTDNDKNADQSLSLYDPRYQDLGENYVISTRHSRRQSDIQQNDDNKSPESLESSSSPRQYYSEFPPRAETGGDAKQPQNAYPTPSDDAVETYNSYSCYQQRESARDRVRDSGHELAVLLSDMRAQVSRFDEISASQRFYSVINDLYRHESQIPEIATRPDLDSLDAYATGSKASASPVLFNGAPSPSRFALSPEVKYLVDQYNRQHSIPVVQTAQEIERSNVYKLLFPIRSYLDRIPNRQTGVDPEIKRRITQIKQLHNSSGEGDELVVQRLTPTYKPCRPDNETSRVENTGLAGSSRPTTAELYKIALVKELIHQQLYRIIAHQHVDFQLRNVQLERASCRELASYALSIVNCFTTEALQLQEYYSRCLAMRRKCEAAELKAINLGESYLIYVKQLQLTRQLENELASESPSPIIDEDEKFQIQLQTELDELRVVNIDKLWRKQLI